jgi:DedD protein
MDTALRQRLVGASVLIALAVVVLPMLLGGRPDNEAPALKQIELPRQPPELDFETRRYPVGQADQQRPELPTQNDPKPLPSPRTAPVITPAPVPREGVVTQQGSEPATDALAEDPAAEIPPEASPAARRDPVTNNGGRYVVQVASFGARDNANRLSKTLGGYGYAVLLDTVKSDVGTLHRVRVGPFDSDSEARAVVKKIQSQVKDVKPRVMDLQPEKASQVTRPSDPLVRWVVQVGSFSSATNADKLVARLRLESLSAYKEQVSSAGSTIYRVRVGPFLEREEAIRVDTLINDRLSIDGVVMSAN